MFIVYVIIWHCPVQTQVTNLIFGKSLSLHLRNYGYLLTTPPKRVKIYLKTAYKIHNMDTLSNNKYKNLVKKVKKAFKTRWLNLHASVDGVYEEYVGLLETFSILETEGRSGDSMAKKSSKFLGMFCTLRVMLLSLTALSKIFQTGSITLFKIIPNIEKIKSNLQQILDEQKPLMLLKADMKNRLQRCNMKVDEQVEEKIISMTDRNTKVISWNVMTDFYIMC